tara:strand:+ start:2595 stop:3050 length:456 start_codon:yes stop_codon:yes gene_type:complete
MSFYNLKELNIKLIDFITILSPLGVVKKMVSNGDRHLFDIKFHNKIPIYDGKFNIHIKTHIIESTLLKLFYYSKLGYIINENSCIIEIPNLLKINNSKITDCKIIGKNIRKQLPKDLSKILNEGLNLKNSKITDPQSINIINFEGFNSVNF